MIDELLYEGFITNIFDLPLKTHNYVALIKLTYSRHQGH